MKRITSILAVLALSTAANAADTVDMKWNAEMRTRYSNDANYAGIKGENFGVFGQRNKLGLHLTKGENFQGHVGLINHFNWGSSTNHASSGYNPGANTIIASPATDSNAFVVNEAYGWWKANDMTSIKFGRSAFEIAGGFVISSEDWLSVPYSYDGLWTMWDFEPVSLNVFGLKLNDTRTSSAQGTVNGNSDPENVMYGAVVGFKNLPEALKKAEIHLLQQNDETNRTAATLAGAPATAATRAEIMRYGLFLNGDHMGFDYRAAADMYQGKAKVFTGGSSTDFDVNANMFDLGVGYTFAEMMMLRIGAVYHTDSGADSANMTNKAYKSYQAGQYDAHNWGGSYMHAVTWGNLTYYSLDAGVKPMEDFGANLRWTKFSRTNNKDTVTVYGATAGTVASTDSNDIGSEIDLTLTKSYGDNFSIWALYGVFTPGDMIKNDATAAMGTSTEKEDSHTRIQLQGKLTF